MIHQDGLTMLNINAPNNRASEYTKQNLIELQGEMHTSQSPWDISKTISQ